MVFHTTGGVSCLPCLEPSLNGQYRAPGVCGACGTHAKGAVPFGSDGEHGVARACRIGYLSVRVVYLSRARAWYPHYPQCPRAWDV